MYTSSLTYNPLKSVSVVFSEPCIRSYRFGFNGKEKDNETYGEGNEYDFGARLYDPRIGRWMSIDPKYKPFESPYVGFANNPIMYIDPDGKDIWVGFEATGTYWNRSGDEAGHTMVIVTNYKEVQMEIDGALQTVYIEDGYRVIEHNPHYSPDYHVGTFEETDFESLNGQITIKTVESTGSYFTKEQIQEELDLLEYGKNKVKAHSMTNSYGKEVSSGGTFNILLNNCTDYGIELLGVIGISGDGLGQLDFTNPHTGETWSMSVPNKLYNDLKRIGYTANGDNHVGNTDAARKYIEERGQHRGYSIYTTGRKAMDGPGLKANFKAKQAL